MLGLVSSLTAAGIVLIYRTNRFFNFAQPVIGAFGGQLCFDLVRFTRVGFLPALVAGVLGGALLGALVEVALIRRFFSASRLVLTVVSIVLIQFLPPFANSASNYLHLKPNLANISSQDQLTGNASIPLPFRGFHFGVGGLSLRFTFAHVFAIEASLIALLALGAFLRFTRTGVGARAVAENSDRALLLGISVPLVSSVVWTVAGMLSAVGVILTGVLTNPAIALGFRPEVILPSLVAAVIGRMKSIPVTVSAAVGLSMLQRGFNWSYPRRQSMFDVLLFVILLVALLAQRKQLLRSEGGGDVSSWQAVKEQRPIPKELNEVGGIRVTRVLFIVIGLVAAAAAPYVLDINRTNLLSVAVIQAIAVLSLVVLTGWAGQVSLGQWAFVGAGACLGGCLITNLGVPFWLALILAPVGIAALAVLVGLPALRVRGLFLGITTLAFAFAFEALLNDDKIGRAIRPAVVERPTLFFFNFDDGRSMYYLTVVAFVGCLFLVRGLRRARLGRVLIGMRENEANLQSFGVSVVRMKLIAFAASGAIAGFAGVLFAMQQRAVSPESFGGFESITIFITAVLGGLGSVAGPLLGSLFMTLVNNFITNAILQTLLTTAPVIVVLYLAPGGLIEVFTRLRDSVLRIVAQRRQIIVPSLFADYDPDVLAHRLIPMAAVDEHHSPVAALGGPGYALSSEMYRGDGGSVPDRLELEEPEKLALRAGATE